MGGPPRTPGHATALISEIALVWMGHFLLDRTDKSFRVFQQDLDGEGGSKQHEQMQLSGCYCFSVVAVSCYCHIQISRFELL